jgi:hypothetical protein
LELEPGEEDELFDLPKGFSDPHLREVERHRIEPLAPKPKRRRKSKPAPEPEPPAFTPADYGFGPSEAPPFMTPSDTGSPPDAPVNEQES